MNDNSEITKPTQAITSLLSGLSLVHGYGVESRRLAAERNAHAGGSTLKGKAAGQHSKASRKAANKQKKQSRRKNRS
jgi:hypothetical protein